MVLWCRIAPELDSRLSQLRPRSHRLVPLAALLLHLLVVVGAPVVDSAFDRSAPDTEIHIEAQNESPCLPIHNDLDCQICRVISRDQIGSVRLGPALGLTCTVALSISTTMPWHRTAVVASTLGARAPPLI